MGRQPAEMYGYYDYSGYYYPAYGYYPAPPPYRGGRWGGRGRGRGGRGGRGPYPPAQAAGESTTAVGGA
jgi:hypothetical protein